MKKALFQICLFIIVFINLEKCLAQEYQASEPTVSQFLYNRNDFPLNYNGDLNFSYPLLNVPGINGLNFDLNLLYTSGGGVKASENGSWVGLGWNLNTCQINCAPAFNESNGVESNANDMFYVNLPGLNHAFYNISATSEEIWRTNIFDKINILDIESDLETEDYTGFVITSKDGTRYVFNSPLKRTSPKPLNNHSLHLYGDFTNVWYTYAIRLTAILGPDYIDGGGTSQYIPDDGGSDYGSWIKFEYDTPLVRTIQMGSSTTQRIEIGYLSKIITPTYKAKFNIAYLQEEQTSNEYLLTFDDFDNPLFNIGYLKRLKSIQLFTKEADESSSTNILKEVSFNITKEFGWYDSSFLTTYNRTKLNNVTIYGSGGSSNNSVIDNIAFEYYDYTPQNGYSDPWGFYSRYQDANNWTDSEQVDRWMLKKIIYYSGGFEQFEYESDKFITCSGSPMYSEGELVYGGGVRIKKKTVNDGLGHSYDYLYSYAINHNGYGFISGYPGLAFKNNKSNRLHFSSVGSSYNNDVHYPDITVQNPDLSKTTYYYTTAASAYSSSYATSDELAPPTCDNTESNQGIVYTRQNEEKKYHDCIGYVNVVSNPGFLLYWDDVYFMHEFTNSWKRGIVWKIVKKNISNLPIQEVKNYYYMKPMGARQYQVSFDGSAVHTCYFSYGYPRLDEVITKTFDSNGQNPVESVVSYEYHSTSKLITKITETNSDGNERRARYYYMIDGEFEIDANSDAATVFTNKHMYSQINAVAVHNSNGWDYSTGGSLESLEITWWDEVSKKQRYKTIWTDDEGDKDAESVILPGSIDVDDEWIKISMENYDSHKRLIESIDGNGNVTKYYYGTSNSPFSNSTSNYYVTGIQKQNGTLDTVLPSISGNRPGDDMFLEYQYNNLGQVTKIVDENGKSIYYEYDNSWRLSGQKNNSQTSILSYNYHNKAEGADGGVFDSDDPNAINTSKYYNSTDVGSFVKYFDGLGREIQSQINLGNSMILQGKVYNSMGQLAVITKPIEDVQMTSHDYSTSLIEADWIIGNAMTSESKVNNYYTNTSNDESLPPHAGGYPYTFTKYVNGFSDRIEQVGKPGYDYRIVLNGNQIEYSYGTNDDIITIGSKSYSAQKLYKTIVTDECNKKVTEYKDIFGNTVLKVIDPGSTSVNLNLQTGFIYDIRGSLVKILPPKSNLSGTSPYCTNMTYNSIGQMLTKSSPDAGLVEYKYDNNGNLRFIRDAVHRSTTDLDRFVFNIYDELNRLIITGETTNTSYTPDWTELNGNNDYIDGANDFENFDTPGTTYQIVNCYDEAPDYGSEGVWKDALDRGTLNNLKGRLAATAYYDKVSGKYGYTYYSYNNDGNIESQYQDLPGNELGCKKINYFYDWQGNITNIYYQPFTLDRFYINYEYDLAGRVSAINARLRSWGSFFPITEYEYWPTGQVKSVIYNLYDDDDSNDKTINYQMHIRDWIKKIDLNNTFQVEYDFFNNGNIKDMDQKVDGDLDNSLADETSYGYDISYDNAYRLKGATATNTPAISVGYSYDDNGNILGLGRGSSSTPSQNYFYIANKNQLAYLSGQTNPNFKYDLNGNVTDVTDKGIEDIYYNYLNLPYQIDFSSDWIKYGYDATGKRVYKKAYISE